jgi:hypothetical protein
VTKDNFDDQDVQAALARETHDGKGGHDVPESNFRSFATEGVEKPVKLLPLDIVAGQVRMGKWGEPKVRASRLSAAGYDVTAVEAEVLRQISRGAPSAY